MKKNNKQMSFIDIDNDFVEEVQEEKTVSVEDAIATAYKSGVTIKNIVKEFNTSYGRVYGILNSKGVPLRNGRYKRSESGSRLQNMSKLEQASLIADYQKGVPLSEIRKKYSINKHGCYSILDAHNIPRKQDHKYKNKMAIKQARVDTRIPTVVLSEGMLEVSKEGEILNIVIHKELTSSIDRVNVNFKLAE